MRIDTALNHRNKWKTRIVDIYSAARIYGSKHDYIIDEKQRLVYQDPAWKKVPEWVRSYIYGYDSCMFDDLYRHHLNWRFEWDGKWYDWDDLPQDGHDHYCQADVHGHHVWKDTGKVFS